MNVNLISVDEEYKRLSKNDPDIQALAEDIRANGLIQPIGVNRKHEIIWGRKRLFAVKEILGQGNIDCRTVDVEGADKELKTIAENLFRKNLDFWERGELLARYYKLMAEKYPDRYNPDGTKKAGRKPGDDGDHAHTAVELSEGLGASGRTSYEDLQVARDIEPEVKDVLKKHGVKKYAAITISRLDPKVQKKIADRLTAKDKTANLKKVLAEFEIEPERGKEKLWKALKDKKDSAKEVIDIEPAYEYNIFGAGKFSQEVSHMLKAREAGVNVVPVQLVYVEKLKKAMIVYYYSADKPPTPSLKNALKKAELALSGKGNLGIHTVTAEFDSSGEHFILNGKRVARHRLESFVSGTAQKETYKGTK